MSELFEKASRRKLRFTVGKGAMSVEDLWDLPLRGAVSLNTLAQRIDSSIKEQSAQDFVGGTVRTSTENLQLDIVKHVIAVRLEEDKAKNLKEANRTKLAKIKEEQAKREDSSLVELSDDELKALEKELS